MYCQEPWEKWRGHRYTILYSHPFAKFPVGTCLKKKKLLEQKGRWNHQSHIDVNAPASFHKWCVCVWSVAQSCLTLCNPMHCSSPGSSVHRIFQARILEQVDISYSRGSSWPRDWTHISCVSCRFFTPELTGKPLQVMSISQNKKATQQLTLLLFVARKYRDAGPKVIFTCKWAWKD